MIRGARVRRVDMGSLQGRVGLGTERGLVVCMLLFLRTPKKFLPTAIV